MVRRRPIAVLLGALLLWPMAVFAQVDPPPGLDPAVVLPAPPNPIRNATLAEAVAAFPEAPPAPPVGPELTPEQRDEALFNYLAGREDALQGRWLAAATKLEAARALDPGAPAILRELITVYGALRNDARVLAAVEALHAADPSDGEARLMLAMDALGKQKMTDVVRLLGSVRVADTGLDFDPAGPVLADFGLHVAFMKLGYDAAAIRAGRSALAEMDFALGGGTRFRQRVGSVFRQRASMWRAIGDAHCRSGRWIEARAAYATAAALPIPDPEMLAARRIYVELRLERPEAAEDLLVDRLQVAAPDLTETTLSLCRYLTDQLGSLPQAQTAVRDLSRDFPNSVLIARAAAMLLPRDEATALLRDFVQTRPRDLGAVRQLLDWIAPGNPDDAVSLVAVLSDDQPDLTDVYVHALLRALPDPTSALRLDTDAVEPDDPATAAVRARALQARFALGRAWQTTERALQRWPDDPGLAMLAVQLAALLDEPPLVEAAAQRFAGAEDFYGQRAVAEAWLTIGDVDRAASAAKAARQTARDVDEVADVEVLFGRVALERGSRLGGERRAEAFREAADYLREAWRIDPENEVAPVLLLEIYAGRDVLFDAEEARSIMIEIRRTQPSGPLVDRLTAEEAIRRGRFGIAVERMLALAAERPHDPQPFGIALTAWDGLGRIVDAERWLAGRLEEHPGDPLALDQYVRLLLSEERSDDALRILDAQPSAEGDPAVLRLRELALSVRGDTAAAVALAKARLDSRPEGTRRALQRAVVLAGAERYKEAGQALEKLLKQADRATPRHLEAAVALSTQLGDGPMPRPRLTLGLVNAVVDLAPDRSLPVYTAGLRALAFIGDDAAAFDVLADRAAREALNAGSADAGALLPWRDLAQRLCDDGFPAFAGRALRARLAVDVGFDAQAITQLVSMILIADAAAGRADLSLQLLQELDVEGRLPNLTDGPPNLGDVLVEASQVYTLLGQEAGSERLLRVAVSRPDVGPMAFNNLGYQLIENGNGSDEVVRWIERAGAAMPDDPSTTDTVAWLRYKQGRFTTDAAAGTPGALELLLKAVDASDDPGPEMLDHLGDAYWRTGAPREAVAAWQAALDTLDDPETAGRTRRNLLLIQTNIWGLLVRDPDELYDASFGTRRTTLRAKLDAVAASREPEVAPTFAELAARGEPGEPGSTP